MASKTSKVILSVILVIVISCAVYAQNISKPINATYRNIKLVVDGIEVTPKDVDGNIVEPFIYNGTTYLPVRAVGQAFNKNVEWDGNTSTVYIGEVAKPAKQVYLYSRPYIACDDKSYFESGKSRKANDVLCTNFIKFAFNFGNTKENDIDGRYYGSNSVTYPTNTQAKKVTGTLLPILGYATNHCEYQLSMYDESGNCIYRSPLMSGATEPTDFEVDVADTVSLKFEVTTNGSYIDYYCAIKDLAIYTTDY